MFSAISTSTTIAIAPVSAVSAAAPVAPVMPAAAPSPAPDTTTATLNPALADEIDTADENAAPAPAERHTYSTARIPVTLDAQLMQAENRLADCVNCPSAKTPAGQAQIDAVSSQIRHIRQRMFDRDGADAYSAVPTPIGLNLDACA